MVGLVRVVPIVVFSMISGVVADAWDRRRLMLVTQILAGHRGAGARPADVPRPDQASWPLYALAALGSAVGAFDLPARQALGADARAARASAQRDQPQHDHVADGVGGRAVARWARDRLHRRRLGLRRQRRLVRVRHRRAADDARRAARSRRRRPARRDDVSLARGARRAAVRVPLAAHSIDDAARLLRDVLLVGHGAAADFRAGHPARRGARATAGSTRRRPSARSRRARAWCR